MSLMALSKKEKRAYGALVLGLSLFGLFSSFNDDGSTGPRRFLLGEYVGTARKRVALIRPFGPSDGEAMVRSFDLWDTRWPCVVDDPDYEVDLVLSYSRNIEGDAQASAFVDAVKNKFMSAGGGMEGSGAGGWPECFSGLRLIESNLDPSKDKYERHPTTGVPESIDWVSGPNGQFRKSMSEVMAVTDPISPDEPYYKLAMIMEADNQPQRTGWLSELLDDVKERTPFAIMGSKFTAHVWEGMKDILPRSLVHHINGNAFYNLTHPLFRHVLKELIDEAGTEFEAIPYDYRISQIIHEGQFGTSPEFPFPWITRDDGSKVTLTPNKNKFRRWWMNYGGHGVMDPVKESGVMANFAESNYLMEHIEDRHAIVHGLNVYKPLNPETHKISLVVSAWDNCRDHHDILSKLDQGNHPFHEVVVVDNPRQEVIETSDTLPETSFPVKLQGRLAADITDVCDVIVSTQWFMHTNTHHRVVNNIDLLFTQESPISRPIVPFTPAEAFHCQSNSGCQETLRIAREIYPGLDKVVLDMDMLYHLPSRDAFCKFWKQLYGMNGEVLEAREGGRRMANQNRTPITPTATAYMAYLYHTGVADSLYKFTNVLVHGSSPLFVRAELAELNAAELNALEGRFAVDTDVEPPKVDTSAWGMAKDTDAEPKRKLEQLERKLGVDDCTPKTPGPKKNGHVILASKCLAHQVQNVHHQHLTLSVPLTPNFSFKNVVGRVRK